MKQYIVKLTDAQDKALHYVASSAQDWIQNAVNARCIDAIDEIVYLEIERRLLNGETISGTKEDIVLSAPIKTAAERNMENINNIL